MDSPELRRLEGQLSREILWIYLLSILKSSGPMHAYVLREKVRERFGFLPGQVTAYIVLYKLESRGYVKTRKEANRVVYSIAASGRNLLKEAEKSFRQKQKLLF